MQTNSYLLTFLILLFFLIEGCEKPRQVEDIRPVRTIVAESKIHDDSEIITGQIAAHRYEKASFRISGKLSERVVSSGSPVKAGQVIARLEDTIEKNTLTAANAEVAATRAALEQAEKVEKRASVLVQSQAVSKNDYDEALCLLKSAKARLEAAESRARIASEQLDYTALKAEKDGIVTDKLAEVGEVVAAGQPIVRIAESSEKDAVFDFPEDLVRGGLAQGQKIEVCLDRYRDVCAMAVVYEIAPEADPVTRTYLTKAVLENPPAGMLLGATVIGRIILRQEPSIQIPAAALTRQEKSPAVWVVDPSTCCVRLKSIEIAQYGSDKVIVSKGIKPGYRIVTAGVQALHQGQKVRFVEDDDERC